MTEASPPPPGSYAIAPPTASRGWRWWLSALEVRLRFVLLVLVILVVTTQWSRLRGGWDGLMQKLRGSQTAAAVSGDKEYFCPMDPGVISVWPAICPICNMDLVQRQKHEAQILPEGVIARMQLSPYRIQLAGIRTAEVKPRELVDEIPVFGTIATAEDPSKADLQFVASVSDLDRARLSEPKSATLHPVNSNSQSFEVVLHPLEQAERSSLAFRIESEQPLPTWMATGETVSGKIHVPAKPEASETGPKEPVQNVVLAIPESALVDHGSRQLVFVESMPGMFDAREVRLGRRCGDWYPVLRGLKEGERIAEAGAFLIDAETRLNPSLAVAYFGANQASTGSRAPQVQVASAKPSPLSPEDVALATSQSTCPVTDLPLDSMGGPVPVMVEGRKVFICCKGCEGKLKQDAKKYLAKLPPP